MGISAAPAIVWEIPMVALSDNGKCNPFSLSLTPTNPPSVFLTHSLLFATCLWLCLFIFNGFLFHISLCLFLALWFSNIIAFISQANMVRSETDTVKSLSHYLQRSRLPFSHIRSSHCCEKWLLVTFTTFPLKMSKHIKISSLWRLIFRQCKRGHALYLITLN